MNCPNCELPTLSDQQFCRSCGWALRSGGSSRVNPQLWGLMLAFGGILIALVGKMLIDEKLIVFSGVITSVIGIFLVAAFPMLKSLLLPKLNIGRTPQQSLPPAETTKKLSPINDFAYIPSVVENTTDLLKEPVPIRSKH